MTLTSFQEVIRTQAKEELATIEARIASTPEPTNREEKNVLRGLQRQRGILKWALFGLEVAAGYPTYTVFSTKSTSNNSVE